LIRLCCAILIIENTDHSEDDSEEEDLDDAESESEASLSSSSSIDLSFFSTSSTGFAAEIASNMARALSARILAFLFVEVEAASSVVGSTVWGASSMEVHFFKRFSRA